MEVCCNGGTQWYAFVNVRWNCFQLERMSCCQNWPTVGAFDHTCEKICTVANSFLTDYVFVYRIFRLTRHILPPHCNMSQKTYLIGRNCRLFHPQQHRTPAPAGGFVFWAVSPHSTPKTARLLSSLPLLHAPLNLLVSPHHSVLNFVPNVAGILLGLLPFRRWDR
jgi:hypothetical protein